LVAHTKANISASEAEYACSTELSWWLANARRSIPSCICDGMAAKAVLLAFVVRIKGNLKFRYATTGVVQSFSFRPSKAFC
jgi:hypothetical protein